MENTLESWRPIRFEPEIEQEYLTHLLSRFIPLSRLAFCIGIVAFIGYQSWDLLLDPHALGKTGPLRAAAVLHFIVCIGITFLPSLRAKPGLWPIVLLYAYCGYVILLAVVLSRLPGGFVAGVGGFMLGMIFIPAITNGALQATGILLAQLVVILLMMFVLGGTTFDLINVLAWAGGGVGFAVGFAYLLDVINRQAFQFEQLLITEKQHSESLLLNILPVDIAARLKAREEPLVDRHESVSVLFADLVGFTEISRNITADELVNLLNDLFSRFDKLVEKHDAEKIKTIGDAYMVATGLSGTVARHAENIADLALAMREVFGEFCLENNVDMKIRIGVHSGAVVAGVIGKQKFSYDMWGDTVNVASRMESEGIPDQIQISAETRELLPGCYDTSSRGEIPIKGHSPRATYILY